MNKIVFLYPHGGGGSWLNNLIYHLETRDKTFPAVSVIYDGQQKSSIPVLHPIGWGNGTTMDKPADLLDGEYEKKIMFSTSSPFNLYLNYMVKIAFGNAYKMHELPMLEQFFQLTNQARHWLENKAFADVYYRNIDLDYRLIFQDPKQFINQLFDILDSVEFEYDPDHEYALTHLVGYQKTCPNPTDYFNNQYQLAWLSWCHALTFTNNIQIDGQFSKAVTVEDIAKLLKPHQNKFTDLTHSLMFNWL